MPKDGYPLSIELKTIRSWHYSKGWKGLFAYIRPLWKYGDCGYWQQTKRRRYYLSTAGWSGNEEIIDAMQSNYMFWALCWVQSNRGGHYVFEIRKGSK